MAFSFGQAAPRSLAARTDAEKFQPVRDFLKAVARRNPPLQFVRKTVIDLDHFRAGGADEMVMMPVVPLGQQFKAGRPVPEIKPLYQAHLFQQVHGAINGCQIAVPGRQGAKNFPVGQRARLAVEYLQDGPARPGDFALLPAQALGPMRQRRGGRIRAGGGVAHGQWKSTLITPSAVPRMMAAVLRKLKRWPSLLSNRIVVEMCMKMPMTSAINSRE